MGVGASTVMADMAGRGAGRRRGDSSEVKTGLRGALDRTELTSRNLVSLFSSATRSMEPLPVQSLAELQRELRPLEHRSYTFTNWATTFSSRTRAAYAPETVHHVRQIVQLARRTKRELRAVGSGHSPSDLVCTEGYLLRMDRMQRLLSVTDDGRVTVQAGIKLTKLHELLAPHGLAVSSLGSISDQSLSGAISTATHGSGVTFGNLSTFITALTLVLPDPASTVLTITADSHPDHFQAALCGLGTLGIIVEMEIQCEPTFKLEEETWCISIADFRRDWKRLAESGEHVRCWWFPQVGEVKISRMNRTTKVTSACVDVRTDRTAHHPATVVPLLLPF